MARIPSPARPARYPSTRVPVLRARRSPRNPAGPFADLTWTQQRAAEQWLFKFCARWGTDLPPWRRAILVGVARRLALNPPSRQFGLSLANVSRGRALARSCRLQGIPHPILANRLARRVA